MQMLVILLLLLSHFLLFSISFCFSYFQSICHPSRVRGLQNLRVVDASVIPSSLSGDSYATQVMIAEKAADMLRQIDSVAAIKEYFRHLYEVRHKHVMEEDEIQAHKLVEEKERAAREAKEAREGKAEPPAKKA